jgi:serine/threonine protein kinase
MHEIGDGGSSKVYKSFDYFTEEEYAIKVFNDTSSSMEREILFNKIITRSQSPFFVKYISSSSGYLVTDKTHYFKNYIIFELASKGDIFEYINCGSKGFSEQNCKVMIYKIIITIQALHKMGICHRDIKPQNILLFGENFEIKICDFGLSSIIYGKSGKNLIRGIVGTKGYQAPEIIEGKDYDGEKADIFSLGVLLFNLLNGKPPFKTAKIIDNGRKEDQLYKFINENSDLYWKTMLLTGLSLEFKKLFIRMVAYDPNKRPTIKEILNDDWLKEITNLKPDEFKIYEENLIKELKKREEIIKEKGQNNLSK